MPDTVSLVRRAPEMPSLLRVLIDMSDVPLPDWAEQVVYEYDLGMPTSCFNCWRSLKESSVVYKDKDHSTYYCSEECVRLSAHVESI